MCGGEKIPLLSVLFIFRAAWIYFLKGKVGWWNEKECCPGGGHGLIGSYEGGKGLERDLRVRKALALCWSSKLQEQALKAAQTE